MKEWLKTHQYGLALLYFVFYLGAFFLLEHFSVPQYSVHCFLDDQIPFCEYFIVPYFMWFFLLIGSFVYFLCKDKTDFQNLCFMMFTGMTICIVIYFILPNGLELRGEIPRNNFFCKWVLFLYRVDTPTNVCPSIHVASTVAIYEVCKRSNSLKTHKWRIKALYMIAWLICLSTLFLKQHSVIDVILGYGLTKVLCIMTYHLNWRAWMARLHLEMLL